MTVFRLWSSVKVEFYNFLCLCDAAFQMSTKSVKRLVKGRAHKERPQPSHHKGFLERHKDYKERVCLEFVFL